MRFFTIICYFAVSSLGGGQVILNEVLSNDSTFADSEGEYSDWIEIHNAGDSEVNLRNACLSDDEVNLKKWQFPSDQIIPAGGYLIVFASGKDTVINGEPHTNFKLSAGGEPLALVDPDGTTILSQFPEGFPRLLDRQSFGRGESPDGPSFAILEYATPGTANTGPMLTAELKSFSASAETIREGESVTLNWTGAHARLLSIYGTLLPQPKEPRDYFPVGTSDLETGSLDVSPARSTFYEFRAQNSWSEKTLRIEVKVLPSLETFSMRPDRIVQGGRTVIRWDTGNTGFKVDLGDGFGERSKSPSVYTPFNEVLLPRDSDQWRTSILQTGDLWRSLDFDDSNWENATLPIELGFNEYRAARHRFEVTALDELVNCTLRVTDRSQKVYLNGSPLQSFQEGLWQNFQEVEIPLELLIEGENILTVQGGIGGLDLGVTAWRKVGEEVLRSMTITGRNLEGEISQSLPLRFIDPSEISQEAAALVINEVNTMASFGEWPNPEGQFVELWNVGEEEIDLRYFQLVGSHIAQFGLGMPSVLGPGKFAVAPVTAYPIADLGDTVIGQFEILTWSFKGYGEIHYDLLDPVGRTIDRFLPTQFSESDEFYLWNYQRVDPHKPFSPENTVPFSRIDVHSTPGSALFTIDSLSITPQYVYPGDPVTLKWAFSRPVTASLLPGTGEAPIRMSTQAGELAVSIPLDTTYGPCWSLRLFGDLKLVTGKIEGPRLRPHVRRFTSPRRVIQSGDKVSFEWEMRGSYAVERIFSPDGELPVDLGDTAHDQPMNVVPGDRRQYSLNLSYGDETASVPMTVLFEDGDFSYSAWREKKELPLVDAGDHDHDGLDDFMEYALGTDPLTATQAPLTVRRDGEGDIILEYPHNLLAPDATLVVESSPDSKIWKRHPWGMEFLSSVAPSDSAIATDVYRFLGQLASERHFFRLRAEPTGRAD